MAAPRRLLALLLLLLLLLGLVLAAPGESGTPARTPRRLRGMKGGGPLGKALDGKDAPVGLTRRLVRPRGARRGTGQRPGGWRRYRRPRPRLSHKGPMPF